MSVVDRQAQGDPVLRRWALLLLAGVVSLEMFPATRLWRSWPLLALGTAVVLAVSVMTTPWDTGSPGRRLGRVAARALVIGLVGFLPFAIPYVVDFVQDFAQGGE